MVNAFDVLMWLGEVGFRKFGIYVWIFGCYNQMVLYNIFVNFLPLKFHRFLHQYLNDDAITGLHLRDNGVLLGLSLGPFFILLLFIQKKVIMMWISNQFSCFISNQRALMDKVLVKFTTLCLPIFDSDNSPTIFFYGKKTWIDLLFSNTSIYTEIYFCFSV